MATTHPTLEKEVSHPDSGTLESPVEKRDPESHHHVHSERMTFKKVMALVAMAFLWTGSQIPAYLYGGIPPYSKYLFLNASIVL
jgi:hypothetical protein